MKGTFASVMLLGAFLLAAWVAVFILYLYRK
ncbi:cytochrome c oxidase subunit 2A [Cohnella lubricantis]|uniref:Cytochrome c oxidase subunit 2A n=1 Tax=Cohnella lubricantis TaxID=2163172 RepID=A0A841T5V8_9BACL|nr:cytochrome c oxidase subunit 2A [Cohnella lubricantis]